MWGIRKRSICIGTINGRSIFSIHKVIIVRVVSITHCDRLTTGVIDNSVTTAVIGTVAIT